MVLLAFRAFRPALSPPRYLAATQAHYHQVHYSPYFSLLFFYLLPISPIV
jgi:hypothetical protein